MDLYDFLYPSQAPVRQLAESTARLAAFNKENVESLAKENETLRLYLTAIMQVLIEKGLVSSDEVQARIKALLLPLPGTSNGPDSDNPFASLQ